jgi:hypothetical protein
MKNNATIYLGVSSPLREKEREKLNIAVFNARSFYQRSRAARFRSILAQSHVA